MAKETRFERTSVFVANLPLHVHPSVLEHHMRGTGQDLHVLHVHVMTNGAICFGYAPYC